MSSRIVQIAGSHPSATLPGIWVIVAGAALLAPFAGCSESASATEPSAPEALKCTLLRVGQREQSSAALADVALDVHYFSSPVEGSSVSVRASFDGKPLVSWLYQLSTREITFRRTPDARAAIPSGCSQPTP
jgi:hypothetical protein